MPYCDVSKYEKGRDGTASTGGGIRIFYRTYGRGRTKVLLIIGLAGTHDGWGPQVKALAGTRVPNDREEEQEGAVGGGFDGAAEEDGLEGEGIEVCCFDNRGMGQSSVPTKKSEYTTTVMAKDALALLDHLGWKKAHVFGHSMGGMIACKLAAMAPDRLSSLALLNVTGGGFECIPKIDHQMISIAFRLLMAKKPAERAMVDLETHYTKEYLEEHVGSGKRRIILHREYVKGISSTGMQSNYGFAGQLNACWTHNMTSKELAVIQSAGFLVLVLHGRYDIIAQISHARRLAKKLQPAARMVELHGAHLVSHERPEEVNQSLWELINASETNLNIQEWSSSIQKETEELTLRASISFSESTDDRSNCLSISYDVLAKLQLSILYLFGIFIMGLEHARKLFKLLKPARVEAAPLMR